MELLQNILVLLSFLFASGYLFTKLIWKPSFLTKKKPTKSCGVSGCGCD